MRLKLLLLYAGALLAQTPTSLPIVPAPPDRQVYGVSDLALFQQYTRASYEAKFGVQPPPYDARRATKTWFDSSVSTPMAEYRVVQSGKITQLSLPGHVARTVNLPGEYRYPTWTVQPTRAVVSGAGLSAALDPAGLLTRAEALALSDEIGCREPVTENPGVGVFRYEFPDDEPRRVYNICGHPTAAGLLARQRNQFGVGRPGTWDRASMTFSPDAPFTTESPLPPVPMPIRDLRPDLGEVLVQTPFDVTVQRRSPAPTSVPTNPAFDGDIRQLLQEIKTMLQLLVAARAGGV